MLEAKLAHGALLKKLVEAIKDLVQNANFECNEAGIALQAMDSSHVALVALLLRADGFEPYRCDRNMSLGINVGNLAKILKCANPDDEITLTAVEDADKLSFSFEGKNGGRSSEFELKLMNIDVDQMGLPDGESEASVEMSSSEFQRVCRDMNSIGDTITISLAKDSVKFSVEGDTGNGSVTLKQNASVDEDESTSTKIHIDSPVSQAFSIKYLLNFAKASLLSRKVTLRMNSQLPMLVDYPIEDLGYLRFYLAPKISDEDGDEELMAVDKEEPDDY